MKLPSLILTSLLALSFISLNAKDRPLNTSLITPHKRALNLDLYELPIKVQNAVERNCRGEIINISQIFAYSNIFYKVICKDEQGQNVYLFDTEGFPPSLSN